MIEWPQHLKTEIARRRAVFFIGSGVSASAKNSENIGLPTWSEFLTGCLELVKTNEKENIQRLLKQGNYLSALQGIYNNVNRADYRDYLKKSFSRNDLVNFPVHEVLLDLDLRIVITTNFDQIYEKHCNKYSNEGYTVLNYSDSELGDAIRSDERVIIKAHGCISKPKEVIFTRAQYHNAKMKHPGFYEILKAIFLTHTCIFIGCGMEDPDILLALEDVKITSSSDKPHYFLTLSESMNPIYKDELAETYNIQALEYHPTHDELPSSLEELKNEVLQLRDNNNV